MVSRFVNGMPDTPENRNPRLASGNSESLPDVYIAMGQTAENVARREWISRDEQDRFALRSQARAVDAQDSGFFDREVIPVPLAAGGVMTRGDGPRRGTTLDKLASLAPVFREDGTGTAGNLCPLNDGAAVVVVIEQLPCS